MSAQGMAEWPELAFAELSLFPDTSGMAVLLSLTLTALMQLGGARNETRLVMKQLFSNPRVPAFETRQHLWALLNQENLTSGVEIGVETGTTSQLTLDIWSS
jgi:hypothetical protein